MQVSPEAEAEYFQLMERAQQEYGPKIGAIEQDLWAATAKANAAYGWFQSAPEKEAYQRALAKQQRYERKLADVKYQRDQMENEARGKVGLWSEYGLQAVR